MSRIVEIIVDTVMYGSAAALLALLCTMWVMVCIDFPLLGACISACLVVGFIAQDNQKHKQWFWERKQWFKNKKS